MQTAIEILKTYATDKKLAVAVSGGRDSMCLIHLLLSQPFIKKENITVVNVEHGIRGEDSLNDSKFVADYCERNGLKLEAFQADVPERKIKSGRTEEQEARTVRREIFQNLVKEGKADFVLTAHHRGDNAETVLMHLLRGSGVGGLRGMDIIAEDGKILRPLLFTDRKEIDAYVEKHSVPFVEDATNADTKYTRNFVRKELMPLMDSRFDAEDALVSLSMHAREDDDFINKFVDKKAIIKVAGGFGIKADKLTEDRAISSRYAIALLKRMTDDYSSEAVKSILDCAEESGKSLDIGGGLTVANEYGLVTLYARKSEKYEYKFGLGTFDFGCFELTVEPEDFKNITGMGGEVRELYADMDRIGNAVIGHRENGDTFEPFGGGTRKLKEYLIDKKISGRLRDRLPVLKDGSRVLAVIGSEIAKCVAVTPDTERSVKLSLRLK